MEQLIIGEYTLTLDKETADSIKNDPQIAEQYLALIRQQYGNNYNSCDIENKKDISNTSLATNAKVWTTKVPSKHDHMATLHFLQLRQQYDSEFSDQKTPKRMTWSKIALEMNAANFYVGEGTDGQEKCRQKFQNLQSAYVKYIDKCRQTGEGKITKPPYFDELEEILGRKDKVEPVCIIDSISACGRTDMASSSCSTTSTSGKVIAEPSAEPSPLPRASSSKVDDNRFKNIHRSVTPSKNAVLEKFYQLSKESPDSSKKEFSTMMEFLNKESQQRHELTMALISAITKKGKKRRHSSDSDQ